MKFNPKVEKIDNIEFITYQTKKGKYIMNYNPKLTVKENFEEKYKNTEGYNKLKEQLQKENKQYKYLPQLTFDGVNECFYKLNNYNE